MYSTKANILVVLLAVLTTLIIYRIASREEPKKVRELTYKSGAGRQVPVVGGEKIPPLNPPLIKGGAKGGVEKRRYNGVIRNPFQPLYPPPVVVKEQAPPSPLPAPVPVQVVPEPKGPSPAQTESGRFKFLGFLQKEGESKIFLSRDKEVFIVKKGDSVTIFQVADITDNSVTLLSRDSKEEFKLIIEDVKPTKPELMPGSGRR